MSVTKPAERGATLLLVTASLLLIMGLAAIVVDVGNAFGERRQAQSAVDFAALAALTSAKGANPANAGAAAAMDVVTANLPGRNLQAWAACTDPSPYPVTPSTTGCVSFSDNFERSRVFLPNNDLATTFGQVLGVASITVVASAEAEQNIRVTAEVIPFTVAGEGCLYSNKAPQTVPPCDGPEGGNFGYLDVALFGNEDQGTPSTCQVGDSNQRVAINLAKGSDHMIVEYDGGTPVNDFAVCPNRSENVDELEVKTGAATGGINNGLLNGSPTSINGQPVTASPGRLQPTPESISTTPVRGKELDDTPLREFLNGSGPASCQLPPSEFSEMQTCLDDWTPADGPIFTKSLDQHPRFAAVPIFFTNPIQGGSGSYTIDYFAPIYLETLYYRCTANMCRTIFSPGETGNSDACPSDLNAEPNVINCGHGDASGTDDGQGLTSLVLELGMLHPDTQEFFPGTLEGRELLLLR